MFELKSQEYKNVKIKKNYNSQGAFCQKKTCAESDEEPKTNWRLESLRDCGWTQSLQQHVCSQIQQRRVLIHRSSDWSLQPGSYPWQQWARTIRIEVLSHNKMISHEWSLNNLTWQPSNKLCFHSVFLRSVTLLISLKKNVKIDSDLVKKHQKKQLCDC